MEKCFFEVGKTYTDKNKDTFTVTEINGNLVITDRIIYEDSDTKINLTFIVGGKYYEEIKLINQDSNAKKLIFLHPGGCFVCCDSLHEISGNYETYAHIWPGKVEYFDNKHKLTPDEIRRIENFAKGL